MSLLQETLAAIQPRSQQHAAAFRERLDAAMTQPAGLGILQDMLAAYAGITGSDAPAIPARQTIICCADHGVAAMKVSAYPPETTVQMTANYLISRGAVANALSNFCGSSLEVADLGIAAPTDDLPGLLQKKIAPGTKNCAVGPAMTREQAIQALETGILLAAEHAQKGPVCFLPGEMGIANTTSSAAIAAVFCGLTPEQATGRGTNISDARLKVKIDVVRQALEVNRPQAGDGLDVLQKVGGFELGCIAGIILGAAAHHSFVVLDGFNTGAAALIAQALCPASRDYLMASHLAAEPAHGAMLQKLGLQPCMDMNFRLGEATGSSLAADLLTAALQMQQTLALPAAEQPTEEALFFHESMSAAAAPAGSQTFDFYLQTMPSLSQHAMDACQQRIDNLIKPIYSLGSLEQIAVELAGILHEDRPPLDLSRALLCFSGKQLSTVQCCLTESFSRHAGATTTIAHLLPGRPPAEAFDFSLRLGEELSFSHPIIGLAIAETAPEDNCGTKLHRLREALCQPDGSLRYPADSFLQHLPADLQGDAAALLGAMLGAAHNSSLIVLDNESTEIIARYAEQLCPDIVPYLLHTQPALLRLHMTTGGGCIACLGMRLVDAAMHVLNDMKTFAEASVAVADDGPGARRQIK